MGKQKIKQRALMILSVIIAIGLMITIFSFAESSFSLTDNTVSLIISTIETIGLILSLLIAIKQLEDSKEIARADFLVELNSAFVNNQGNLELYTALQNCIDGKCELKGESCKKCYIDLSKVVVSNYLTFFETIYLLLCNGVITFEMIDDLFAYRFFIAIHSEFVQQQKLATQPENFKNIFCLEYKWLLYREKIAHKIDDDESIYRKHPLKNLMQTDEQRRIYEQWLKEA